MTVQLVKRTIVFAIFLSFIGIGSIAHATEKTPTLSALYAYTGYDGKLDVVQWDIQTRQVTRQFRFALSRPTAYVPGSSALVLDSTSRSMYYIDTDFGDGGFRANAQLMRFQVDDKAPEKVFEAENLWGIYPSPDRRTALLTQRPDYLKGLPHPYCVYDFASGACTKVEM
jgi:hypothetical protein